MKKDAIIKKIGNNLYKLIMRVKTGTFRKIVYIENGVGLKNYDGNINPKPSPPPIPPTPTGPDYLCFTANDAGAQLFMNGMIGDGYTGDLFQLEYSTDKENWQNLNFTDNGDGYVISDIITFSARGDKVYFRGDNPYGSAKNFNPSEDSFDYVFYFNGDSSHSFAVSGDLQTIKDKTGQDKVAGSHYILFAGTEGLRITSAPDLTATTLSPLCYGFLFTEQSYLISPARMPNFTFTDLPRTLNDMSVIGGAFVSMYAETGITQPHVFSGISLPANATEDDLQTLLYSFYGIYIECSCNVTNDSGATINFIPDVVFPIEVSEMQISSYDFAQTYVGNINGFPTINIHGYCDESFDKINTHCYGDYNQIDNSGDVVKWYIPDDTTLSVEIIANYETGLYIFQKWQTSNDSGTTWTDIVGGNPLTMQFSQAGDYYIKAVLIDLSPLATLNVGYGYGECEIDCYYSDPSPVVVNTLEYGDPDFPSNEYTSDLTVKQAKCIDTGFGANCTVLCTPKERYAFVKWQFYVNGSWVDYGSTSSEVSLPIGGSGGEFNMKAICERLP